MVHRIDKTNKCVIKTYRQLPWVENICEKSYTCDNHICISCSITLYIMVRYLLFLQLSSELDKRVQNVWRDFFIYFAIALINNILSSCFKNFGKATRLFLLAKRVLLNCGLTPLKSSFASNNTLLRFDNDHARALLLLQIYNLSRSSKDGNSA